MTNKAYTKLLEKSKQQIDSLEREISLLEDANFVHFLSTFLRKVLFPSGSGAVESRIDELSNELNQIKGRLKSTLTTYAISAENESNVTLLVADAPSLDAEDTQGFLSPLLSLLEEVRFLEDELHKKDVRYFAGNSAHSVGGLENDAEDVDWETFNLNI